MVTWGLGIAPPNMRTLANVSVIVIGVIIASLGEIKFVMIGFIVQILGIVCEATRLAMVERLLSSAEFKMDPLVSLYYFAPACALMNGIMFVFMELPKLSLQQILDLGLFTLLANAMVAFALNIAVVFLVSAIHFSDLYSMTILTGPSDWQDFLARPYPLWSSQGHPPSHGLHGPLQRPSVTAPRFRLQHRPRRPHGLQARQR